MSGHYAYAWTVGGYPVMTPDPNTKPEKQFIDMPRGCVPGVAKFYLLDADAALVLAEEEVTIACTEYHRSDSDLDSWNPTESYEWLEYIPMEVCEKNQEGVSLIKLKDKRHKLDRHKEGRIWNRIAYVAVDSSGVEVIAYEPETINSGTPYTYQEIVNELFDTITAPMLPAHGSDTPSNLYCIGSTAVFLDGLLASIGCALYLQLDGTLAFVETDDMTAPDGFETARAERLVANRETSVKKHGKVVVWPNEYFPYHPASSSDTFGDAEDLEELFIEDHEISDKNTGVLSTRLTDIKNAVEAWHTAESHLFDDTFYGIVPLVPGPGITHVTWGLGGTDTGHETRVRNYSPPMPWPTRCLVTEPRQLWFTATTGIGADSTADVYVQDEVPAGMWTIGTGVQKAYNKGNAIPVDGVGLLFPVNSRWVAVRIC